MYGEIPTIAEEHIPNEDKNKSVDLDQINEDIKQIKPNKEEEIDEELKRSIRILPYFSSMNYEHWKNKMEDLFCSRGFCRSL